MLRVIPVFLLTIIFIAGCDPNGVIYMDSPGTADSEGQLGTENGNDSNTQLSEETDESIDTEFEGKDAIRAKIILYPDYIGGIRKLEVKLKPLEEQAPPFPLATLDLPDLVPGEDFIFHRLQPVGPPFKPGLFRLQVEFYGDAPFPPAACGESMANFVLGPGTGMVEVGEIHLRFEYCP